MSRDLPTRTIDLTTGVVAPTPQAAKRFSPLPESPARREQRPEPVDDLTQRTLPDQEPYYVG